MRGCKLRNMLQADPGWTSRLTEKAAHLGRFCIPLSECIGARVLAAGKAQCRYGSVQGHSVLR
jgi:hypothetical protein